MNKFISNLKGFFSNCLSWIKPKFDFKVALVTFLIGLLTFSSWSALFLGLLTYVLLYLINTQVPATLKNLINIDVDKYAVNAIIGFVLASLLLIII